MRARFGMGLLCICVAAASSHAASFRTLHRFDGAGDGGNPFNALTFDSGRLFGLTSSGVLYAYDLADRKQTSLYDFGFSVAGETPSPGLVSVRGILYGTTYFGGTAGQGSIFSFDPKTRKLTVLYSFTQGDDGGSPQSGVIYSDGSLFGTTATGGTTPLRAGTVFRFDLASGTETVLHSFGNGSDGTGPNGVILHGGMLYGTTWQGGQQNRGTLFRVNPRSGKEKVLYSFGGNPDGSTPESSLVAAGGKFYGTTSFGGPDSLGNLYSFDAKTGVETVLYNFRGHGDGAYPYGGVIARQGVLYGTAAQGGRFDGACVDSRHDVGCGTAYEFDTARGQFRVLHHFSGGFGGGDPYAGLTYHAGAFYGTTMQGGRPGCNRSGCGTVFRLVP